MWVRALQVGISSSCQLPPQEVIPGPPSTEGGARIVPVGEGGRQGPESECFSLIGQGRGWGPPGSFALALAFAAEGPRERSRGKCGVGTEDRGLLPSLGPGSCDLGIGLQGQEARGSTPKALKCVARMQSGQGEWREVAGIGHVLCEILAAAGNVLESREWEHWASAEQGSCQ